MTANSPGGSPGTRGRVPADTFANRLLLARRMNGLTIKEAAALIQVEGEKDVASSWSNWENGRRPRDVLETVQRIATALDCDLEWLMFGGSLAESNRPVTKRPGEATLRYSSMAVRPTDTRPKGRAGNGTDRTTGPSPRRPVRISSLQVA